MPLPDAGNPKESNVYTQLRTKKIEDVTPDEFDIPKDPIYIQPANEDEARRLKLWGELSGTLSSSGPMPNSAKIVATSVAGGGATSGTIFRPDAGEVWQITGATTKAVSASRVELHLTDTDGEQVEVGAETAAATQFDPDGWNPVYIDNNVYLNYFISGLSGTTAFNVSFIRVR